MQRIGDLLGWADMWDASIGGTGYTPRYDGNGQVVAGQAYTYGERVAGGLTRNSDIWVLMGSTNDGGQPAAEITAAALATYRAIRAGSAAPIVVLGVWPMNSQAPAIEAAVKAAVDAFADPLTFFMPITADADTGLARALGSHNRTAMPGATQGVGAFADGNPRHRLRDGQPRPADRRSHPAKGAAAGVADGRKAIRFAPPARYRRGWGACTQ